MPTTTRTFYKRVLPPTGVAFSSSEGQRIFKDALGHDMLNGFFSLIEQYRTQDEPAYCGLASVAMVLNSLAIDPRRVWKGSWRIFHEQMLDCCIPLETVKREGITMTQAACLAKCNGASTDIFPHGSVDVDTFRDMVKHACSVSDYHLIVSYSRRHFQQTGDGHFSPIGGYSPTHDMVLILDTARFKYPPHWVSLSMLYEAMAYEDPTTGTSRGFLKVMASRTLHSVLFALDCSVEDATWASLRRWVDEDVLGMVRGMHDGEASFPNDKNDGHRSHEACSEGGRDVHDLVVRLCMSADADVLASMASRTENAGCDNGTCVQSDAVETLLSEVAMLHLFDDVRAAVGGAAVGGAAVGGAAVGGASPAGASPAGVSPAGASPAEASPAVHAEQSLYEVQKRLLLVLMLEDVIVEAAEAAGWDDERLASLKSCLMNESKEQYRVVGHEVEYLKDQYRALRELDVVSVSHARTEEEEEEDKERRP